MFEMVRPLVPVNGPSAMFSPAEPFRALDRPAVSIKNYVTISAPSFPITSLSVFTVLNYRHGHNQDHIH